MTTTITIIAIMTSFITNYKLDKLIEDLHEEAETYE